MTCQAKKNESTDTELTVSKIENFHKHIHLSDPPNPLLGVYLREMKT